MYVRVGERRGQEPGRSFLGDLNQDRAPALPFPAKFADPLTFNQSTFNRPIDSAFQKALNAAAVDPPFRGLPSVRDLSIDIVSLEPSGANVVTGQYDDDMHYSGSLLKVAAMYAAFQLHKAVHDFGRALGQFKKSFDVRIASAVARIPLSLRTPPRYDEIFTPAREFRTDFAGHVRSMIVYSSEDSAGIIIKALGYSWINGVLQSAGFFKDPRGIWFAGNYKPNFPVVTVPSVNDGPVKQATTCIDMARLFVLLQRDQLVKDAANSRMKELLKDGFSYLKTRGDLPVIASKIGRGQLKKGPGGRPGDCRDAGKGCVLSEASVIRHRSGRLFVTVWQNVLLESDAHLGVKRVAAIIQKTMDGSV